MAQAAVAADVDQPLDVHADLAAEVTLDGQVAVDEVAQAVDLLVGQLAHPRVRVDAGLEQQLLARRRADAVDVLQPDLDALVARQVDPGYSGHLAATPSLKR